MFQDIVVCESSDWTVHDCVTKNGNQCMKLSLLAFTEAGICTLRIDVCILLCIFVLTELSNRRFESASTILRFQDRLSCHLLCQEGL